MSVNSNDKKFKSSEEYDESDVFYDNDCPPPKPPRIHAYEKNYFSNHKIIPVKPQRNGKKISTSTVNLIDFNSLTISDTSDLRHLTKNRAVVPKRKKPKRFDRNLSQNLIQNNENVIENKKMGNNSSEKVKNLNKKVDAIRPQKTRSAEEFSVFRRKAFRHKLSK